jgi:hypothetical protein
MEARDWETVRRLLADDLIVTWPQTRERIRGGEVLMQEDRALRILRRMAEVATSTRHAIASRTPPELPASPLPQLVHASMFRNGRRHARGLQFDAQGSDAAGKRTGARACRSPEDRSGVHGSNAIGEARWARD